MKGAAHAKVVLEQLSTTELYELEDRCSLALEFRGPWQSDNASDFRELLAVGALSKVEALADKIAAITRARAQAEREKAMQRAPQRKAAGAEPPNGGWCLRLEHVQCGKVNCTRPHGPYWYGYRVVGGRRRKVYFGAHKPTPKDLDQAERKLLGNARPRPPATSAPKKRAAKITVTKRKGR